MKNLAVQSILAIVVLVLVVQGTINTLEEKKEIVGGVQLLIAASMILLFLQSEAIHGLPNVISKLDDKGSEFKRLYMQQNQIESAHKENLQMMDTIRAEYNKDLALVENSRKQISELNHQVAKEKENREWFCKQIHAIHCDFYEISEEGKQSEESQKIKNVLIGIVKELKEQDIGIISPENNDDFDDKTMQMKSVQITNDEELGNKISSVIKPGMDNGNGIIEKANVVLYEYKKESAGNEQQSLQKEEASSKILKDGEGAHQQSALDSEEADGTSAGETTTEETTELN